MHAEYKEFDLIILCYKKFTFTLSMIYNRSSSSLAKHLFPTFLLKLFVTQTTRVANVTRLLFWPLYLVNQSLKDLAVTHFGWSRSLVIVSSSLAKHLFPTFLLKLFVTQTTRVANVTRLLFWPLYLVNQSLKDLAVTHFGWSRSLVIVVMFFIDWLASCQLF